MDTLWEIDVIKKMK